MFIKTNKNMLNSQLKIFHGPKSWNQTAQKNAFLDQQSGLNSISYTYKQLLLNPLKIVKIFNVDVFNFYAGYTFLPISQRYNWLYKNFAGADLYFLKFFNKKIILHFQGCDIRNRFQGIKIACQSCQFRDTFCSEVNFENRNKRLKKLIAISDAVVLTTPDLLSEVKHSNKYFLPKLCLSESFNYSPPSANEKIKLIHAPSDRSIKGTDSIVTIVNKHPDKFELFLLENVSKNQVISVAKEVHLAIDQIKVGWYGNFAVEMMSLGLPVIAYISPEFKYLVNNHNFPIVSADENELELVLLNIWNNRNQLAELSQKSKLFISDFHSVSKLSKELNGIYSSIV